MAVPNVDTFEHDIADEIQHKEASLTDIASAGGDIGNLATPHGTSSKLLIALGALFILGVITLIIAYVLMRGSSPAQTTDTATTTANLPDTSTRLLAISPTLYDAIGGNIGTVSKSEYGYAFELLDYTPVFAYMIRNETLYADELAIAVGSTRDSGTSTPNFSFTDTTINNQTMRVGISGDKQLVYAFVNAKTLLVSSSTEGILALRGTLAK